MCKICNTNCKRHSAILSQDNRTDQQRNQMDMLQICLERGFICIALYCCVVTLQTEWEGSSALLHLPLCAMTLHPTGIHLLSATALCLNFQLISYDAFTVIISNTGNIGAELSYNNVGMFISSDAGNSWRKVRLHQETH